MGAPDRANGDVSMRLFGQENAPHRAGRNMQKRPFRNKNYVMFRVAIRIGILD